MRTLVPSADWISFAPSSRSLFPRDLWNIGYSRIELSGCTLSHCGPSRWIETLAFRTSRAWIFFGLPVLVPSPEVHFQDRGQFQWILSHYLEAHTLFRSWTPRIIAGHLDCLRSFEGIRKGKVNVLFRQFNIHEWKRTTYQSLRWSCKRLQKDWNLLGTPNIFVFGTISFL